MNDMMITRRTLLKQLAVFSAGVVLAPSLAGCNSKPSPLYKNIVVTDEQDKLLSLISETIIPKTSTPGANDVGVHEYCIKMVDDCLSKEDQEKWLKGLNEFNALSEKNNKKEFASMDSAERTKFLTELNESKAEDDAHFFFKATKHYTLRGYTTSEYYLTNVENYNIIPGKFKGCVPVTNPS
jgi:hypothetical protein